MAAKKKAPAAARKATKGGANEAEGRQAISPAELSPAGRKRAEALAKQYGFKLREPGEK